MNMYFTNLDKKVKINICCYISIIVNASINYYFKSKQTSYLKYLKL